MKKENYKKYLLFLAAVFITAYSSQAQTTAFNYQGKLTDSGATQASYQMQFKLFDAAAGGSQIGSTVSNSSVAVSDGVFSVSLDFGANVFTGANRFLEISVRRNPGENYTILAPRQQIASSPYSIRTLSAQTADLALNSNQLGGINASEYVTNSTVGSSFIRNGTTQQTGNFNISGNGLFGGSVGIGTNPTSYRLDTLGYVRSLNNQSTGFVSETTGGQNSWARFYMRSSQPNGTPVQSWFMGTSRDFNGNQFYIGDETANQTRMVIATNGNVGFGTTAPNTRLTVSGGVPWTAAGWTASMNMQNVSALGWEANASGQRFGIGQTNGGLYFFRTNSAFGSAANPANYDMVITDTGNIAQPSGGLGLPKAMIWINPNNLIARCYNGVTGVSATNGGQNACGFTVALSDPFSTRIDFGFPVNNSFISFTIKATGTATGGVYTFGEGPSVQTVNQVVIDRSGQFGFHVIVY